MIVVRKLLAVSLLLSLAACQQNEATNSRPETRPAVRAANGTLYDLKCLKGKKPGAMSGCAVDTAAKAKSRMAYHDASQQWYEVTDVTYFIWQISYFDEASMCQWLWGMPSCYNYFGTQAYQGPRCEVGWLYQYQDLPQAQARNCGWYWNPWYTPPTQGGWYPWYPQQPTYPQLSCSQLKAERDWWASQAQYCNNDNECVVSYSVAEWGSCNPPATNQWLQTAELDYWAGEYEAACLGSTGTVFCPAIACPAPKCVAGRCSQGCQ